MFRMETGQQGDKKSPWLKTAGAGAVFLLLVLLFCALVQKHAARGYIDTMEMKKTGTETNLDGNEDGQDVQGDRKEMEQEEQEDEQKVAYLSFDDGPSSLTEKYLDILKEHQIRATFFVIGNQAEQQPELVEREIKEGHEVGVHTFTHESGEIYQSADAYEQDVEKVVELLQGRFQYSPRLWRFPWGSANCYIYPYKKDIVERLQSKNLEYVDWNVSAEDSVGTPSVSSILENIRKDCFRFSQPVVLMHDSESNQATLDSLEAVISLFEDEGYAFGTISERKENCHFGEY